MPAGVPDENAPPADLRLVPGALSVWAGTLLGILAGAETAWWMAAAAAAGLIALVALRPTGWAGWVAVAAFLVAALTITALRQAERSADPVSAAAEKGSWVRISGVVGGFPRAGAAGFTAPDGPSPAGAGSPDGATSGPDLSRWRVDIGVRTVDVGGARWTSTVRLTVLASGRRWSTLLPGQTVHVAGRLTASTFGGLPTVSLTARDPPDALDDASMPYRVAGAIRSALHRTAADLDGDAAGLLPGLVVGDTGGIDERLDADAKATGISHLLAVSGSHFAILCGMVVVVLRRLGPRTASVGAAITLIGLVILVGPAPSVLRAAVMGGVGVLALLAGRTRSSLPALAAAAVALLLVDPDLAVSAGFALSVLATGGLIMLAPLWSAILQRRGVPAGWADLVAIPVAAQVVTMPVIALISGSVSVVGVLANLLVAPVVGVALVLGVLCASTGPWCPGAAGALAHLIAPLLNWIAWVAHTLARWPNATVPWPATPAGATLLAAVTICAVMLMRRRWFRLSVLSAAVGVSFVVVPVRVWAPGWPMAGWLLVACEVGQGDGLVLATGQPGTAIVVDTGPDPGLMDGCLTRLGIDTIALLVLTHLHADHVDGLAGAMDGRSVGSIAVGPGREPAAAWRDVDAAAAVKDVPLVQFRPGDGFRTGSATLSVLGPAGEFHGTDSDPNNDSLVIMAELAGTRILLTGDIEIEAQQALLNAGVELDADVLKVPHHGSADLLERFVNRVSPAAAVIGVGAGNDYGHPAERALGMLERAGASSILRTDTQGDVAVGVRDGALTAAARGPTLRSGSG